MLGRGQSGHERRPATTVPDTAVGLPLYGVGRRCELVGLSPRHCRAGEESKWGRGAQGCGRGKQMAMASLDAVKRQRVKDEAREGGEAQALGMPSCDAVLRFIDDDGLQAASRREAVWRRMCAAGLGAPSFRPMSLPGDGQRAAARVAGCWREGGGLATGPGGPGLWAGDWRGAGAVTVAQRDGHAARLSLGRPPARPPAQGQGPACLPACLPAAAQGLWPRSARQAAATARWARRVGRLSRVEKQTQTDPTETTKQLRFPVIYGPPRNEPSTGRDAY